MKRVKRCKRFNADKWLKENLENLVNKFPGEYVIVADGKLYRNGTPSQLREQGRADHPNATILGIRIPRPEDFLCALIIR